MKPITGYKAGDMARDARAAKVSRYMEGVLASMNTLGPPILSPELTARYDGLVTIVRKPKRPRNTL